MNNSLNKGNTFYFIASSLATLTLLTSLALNVPSSLILALAVLSALALVLLYKIISNNKRIENKFAQKERELKSEITLAANKEVEKLKDQLIREKQNLNREVSKVSELEIENKSLEEKLEAQMNLIFGITGELEKVTKEKDELAAQEKELLHKILHLYEQLQEKKDTLAKKEKCITELKRKIDNDKYEELHKEIEKLHKEKEELSKKIDELRKEKHMLYAKKEELHERQKELCVELDELRCKFKEINQKNKNLSQELKKKFEELDKADGLIKNQSSELDGIRKDFNNEVKELQDSLRERDSQIKQLEEDLSKKEEERVLCIKVMKEYMICKLEGSIKRSKVIKNDDKAVILQEIPVMRSMLEEVIQHLLELVKDSGYESPLGETLPGDLGYESLPVSRSSNPIKSPNSLLTESYERNQSEGICKT